MLDIEVVAIRELDEKAGFMTLDAWFRMEWNDSRLTWDPKKYAGIKEVHLSHHEVWRPDIRLYNRVKLSDMETQADVLCKVNHRGRVVWMPPSTFHSSCAMDLRFYPFDVQTCNLTFGSWSLNGLDIWLDLNRRPRSVKFTSMFVENNQWEVVANRAFVNVMYYVCCPEPYPEATFELRLRRRSPYYKYTTLFPTLGVVGLTLVTFWLPPDATDKIILGGVNFVSLVLILIHLSWRVPPTGKTIPMIIAFCGNLIMIVMTSIILSVISIIWGRARYNRSAPKWIRSLLNSLLGQCLCLNRPIVLRHENHVDDITSIDLDNSGALSDAAIKLDYCTSEWMQCLQLVDRVNFIIFVGVIISTLAGAFTLNE